MTVGGFICAVRKYLWLKPTEGLYLYLDDNLPMLNSKISDLYQTSRDEDGFLYMIYTHQEDKGSD
jgi:GABA(A) receptor-associated protein